MESVALGIDQTVLRDQIIVFAHGIFDVYSMSAKSFLAVPFQTKLYQAGQTCLFLLPKVDDVCPTECGIPHHVRQRASPLMMPSERAEAYVSRARKLIFVAFAAYVWVETGLLEQVKIVARNSAAAASGETLLAKRGEVFFHVHVAKTAGSTLNRAFARKYLGVCGHKGYSFSQAYDDRVRENSDRTYAGYGLDRVHPERMSGWGFHNCVFISHECSHDEFVSVARLPAFRNVSKTVIIPCRDPVDHFFSQCNFNNENFTKIAETSVDCSAAISSCALAWNRFDATMLHVFDNVIMFKYDEIELLMESIDAALPKRTISLKDRRYYRTNADRNTHNEKGSTSCSLETLRAELTRRWSYYRLCENYLGNSNYVKIATNKISIT